jgi:Flp pilus assembly secretin CpaC
VTDRPTTPDPQPPEYLITHIQDALGRDPRARELGVDVRVAGGRVVLTGTVATAEQRASIGEVVCELVDCEAPEGHEVVNELAVVEHREGGPVEELA